MKLSVFFNLVSEPRTRLKDEGEYHVYRRNYCLLHVPNVINNLHAILSKNDIPRAK